MMAKLNKHKFTVSGAHRSRRSTSKGQIELYMHYDVDKATFFFDTTEVREYFPNFPGFTWHCETAKAAVSAMKTWLASNHVKTRMLRIKLGLPSRLTGGPNPKWNKGNIFEEEFLSASADKPEFLRQMLDRGFLKHGISIEFTRIMRLEHEGHSLYYECEEDWTFNADGYSSNHKENLIEWTEETEQFLISMQAQLDTLCKRVLAFFSTATPQELVSKMTKAVVENSQKLISQSAP